jgi:hypothetical protein
MSTIKFVGLFIAIVCVHAVAFFLPLVKIDSNIVAIAAQISLCISLSILVIADTVCGILKEYLKTIISNQETLIKRKEKG